jgi:hypothetical protein
MLSHFLTGRPSAVFRRPPGEQSYSMTSGPVAGVVDWLSRVALPFGASSRGVSKARSSSSDLAPSLSRTASHIFRGRGGVFPRPGLGSVRPAVTLDIAAKPGRGQYRHPPDLLDRHNTKGTFSSWAGSPSVVHSWCAASRRGSRNRLPQPVAPSSLHPQSGRVPRGPEASGRAGTGGGPAVQG